MCGIVGTVGDLALREQSHVDDLMTRGLASLSHRGPDGSGWISLSSMPVVLGHTRLAIIDLQETSAQPMVNAEGNCWLTFNGEIYNFREIRQALEEEGCEFRTSGDTEVLLEALTSWGIARTLEAVRGMFAFAFADSRTKSVTLARDRFGEKPLFLALDHGSVRFASEIKALAATGLPLSLDKDAAEAFLSLSYSPLPRTTSCEVFAVEPGSFVEIPTSPVIRAEDLRSTRYFDCRSVASASMKRGFQGDLVAAVNEFHSVFDQSVRRQMVSDVPLGAFLSGGIDSSLVVASMMRSSSSIVRSFSIGFAESDFNEADVAGDVARALGTEHTEFVVSESDALEVISKLPTVYDDPFGDSSAIPTYLLSQLTKQYVTVALSGDGGDELFAGYNRYFLGTRAWRTLSHVPRFARRSLAGIFASIPATQLDQLGRITSGGGKRIFDGRLSARRSKILALLRAEQLEDLYAEVVSHHSGLDLRNFQLVEWLPASPEGLSPAEMMMLWDTQTYLPGDILTKVDRAAMAHSLETRVPFLDSDVFEFAWSLPLDMKVRDGQGKFILKEALADRVPRQIWDRPKRGFAVPLAAWLRGGLKEWAEGVLFEPSSCDEIIKNDRLKALWDEHQNGSTNNQDILWNMLMLRMWLREWTQDR